MSGKAGRAEKRAKGANPGWGVSGSAGLKWRGNRFKWRAFGGVLSGSAELRCPQLRYHFLC